MKKNNSHTQIFTVLGILLILVGFILIKTITNPEGILKALPYLCIGIGCGVFGHNFGNIISKEALKGHPDLVKNIEIEQNDERNVMIAAFSKAKAFDLMLPVYGAVMLAFALMNVDVLVILILVIAYLLIVFYSIFFSNKYRKEL